MRILLYLLCVLLYLSLRMRLHSHLNDPWRHQKSFSFFLLFLHSQYFLFWYLAILSSFLFRFFFKRLLIWLSFRLNWHQLRPLKFLYFQQFNPFDLVFLDLCHSINRHVLLGLLFAFWMGFRSWTRLVFSLPFKHKMWFSFSFGLSWKETQHFVPNVIRNPVWMLRRPKCVKLSIY